MDTFTRDDLAMLVGNQGKHCLSLYIPTYRTGSETQQNQIRFKNALSKAEETWEQLGNGAPPETILKPARQLLEDTPFWSRQGDGLSLFFTPDIFQAYRLPIHFDELVVMSDRFHLKPLLPLLSKEMSFYILALSLERARLLECSFQQVREIETDAFPDGLDETLQYDDIQKQVQFHTGTRRGGGPDRRRAMYHGQGAAGDENGTAALRYCQDIDRAFRELVSDRRASLVLAGLHPLVAMFRDVTGHGQVFESAVTGNPDELSPTELHRRAWELMDPHWRRSREAAMDRYRQLAETDGASGDLREIVPAAINGRVDCLFVAIGVQQWGRFDPENGSMDIHGRPGSGDGDLLDLAAIQTLMKGGTVFTLRREDMPGNTLAAALFRY